MQWKHLKNLETTLTMESNDLYVKLAFHQSHVLLNQLIINHFFWVAIYSNNVSLSTLTKFL